jgi:hypothetical protein
MDESLISEAISNLLKLNINQPTIEITMNLKNIRE